MTNAETATRQQVILRKKNSGVAFVLLDCAGKANLLTTQVLSEFENAVEEIAGDDAICAVVIVSGKADTFCSGADLHQIMKFTTQSQALDLSKRGQAVFNALADLPKPTVGAINGICLGGGLELVLSCDRRIATTAPITMFGLPEVRLGFVPGLGGTQRLPRQIGLRGALEIILGAEPVSADRALELNIVDELVSPDDLMRRAEALALELTNSPAGERKIVAPPMDPEKEKKLFAMSERSVRIKTKGHYPAQPRALQVIKTGLNEGMQAGLDAEAKAFAELSVGEVSRNLVFLFFTSEFARMTAGSISSRYQGSDHSVIGIIGGGLMGTTMARLAVSRGYKVLLRAANKERQDEAINRALDSIARHEAKQKEDQKAKGELVSVVDDKQLAEASLILETCAEDAQVKLEVLAQISQAMNPESILATNTSSLSVTKLASAVAYPANFVGLHFFNPVDKMPLVELVANPQTDKLAMARATALIHQLGKMPIVVKDSAGFLVNRLLSCYLADAARLASEQKMPVNWIEEAATDFGMPMGPMALLDEVGLDLANMVAHALSSAFGDRFAPPDSLAKALSVGMVGKKTGRGVYLWEDDKKLEFNPQLHDDIGIEISSEKIDPTFSEELAQIMILPMVDEAARCLDEKIVRRAREIDLCMVMGLGFPPFRGGLLRYADGLGIDTVIEKLESIYKRGGSQRSVSDYMKRLADQNRGFYSRSADEN